MKVLLSVLDWLWNLRGVEGYRTVIAKTVIIGLAAYQWASTSPSITQFFDAPDVPANVVAAITAYFAAKMPGFAKAHPKD